MARYKRGADGYYRASIVIGRSASGGQRRKMVNALVHCDYMIQGSEIHVDIYDDRLNRLTAGMTYFWGVHRYNRQSNGSRVFLCPLIFSFIRCFYQYLSLTGEQEGNKTPAPKIRHRRRIYLTSLPASSSLSLF
ncbi:MAG: hypothetical protein LBR85_07845 [Oscillospiraceae bacterium]|nr:hypothetical protein [Oscillospiraceae bacterium]